MRQHEAALYTRVESRYFEPIERLANGDDIRLRLVQALGGTAEIRTRGIWVSVSPLFSARLPSHGWKLHISATPSTFDEVIHHLIEAFGEGPLCFKVLRDTRLVLPSVSKWWPRAAVGKFATVYFATPEECSRAVERLRPRLGHLNGPTVLTDRRVPGSNCMFLRYGSFRPTGIEPDGRLSYELVGPNGETWTDDRRPKFTLPPWVTEFPLDLAGERSEEAPEILKRFEFKAAIRFSGSGGVYIAAERATGRDVVVKEALPNAGYTGNGLSAQDRLRAEYDILKTLRDIGVGPEPIDLIESEGHLFLAESRVPGRDLWRFLATTHPLLQWSTVEARSLYVSRMQRILGRLDSLLDKLHRSGFVFGDLSLTNIVIDDSDNLQLVDFEATREIGSDPDNYLRTPGFVPPEDHPQWTSGPELDLFGRAAVEASMIFPRSNLMELDSSAFARSIQYAGAKLGLDTTALISTLAPDVTEGGAAFPALPTVVPPPSHWARWREGLVSEILAELDWDSEERLVPADPDMYETNRLSLAYGGAGVLVALTHSGQDVRSRGVEWLNSAVRSSDRLPPGLWFGKSGVALSFLALGERQAAERLLDEAYLDRHRLPHDVATGKAGLGLGLLDLARAGVAAAADRAERLAHEILLAAKDDGDGLYWGPPPRGGHRIGQLYGSSGIASFYLELSQVTGRDDFRHIGMRALEFDLVKGRPKGSRRGLVFPAKVGSSTEEPYYSAGGVGVGLAVVRAVRLGLIEDGTELLRRILDGVVPRDVLTINGGLWNGMSGLGLFALAAAQAGVAEGLDRARDLATATLALCSRRATGIAVPGDTVLRHSCDLAAGAAGLLTYLVELERCESDPHLGEERFSDVEAARPGLLWL